MTEYLKNILAVIFFKIFPKTFGRGYERYKVYCIKRIINNKRIYNDQYLDERIVEIPWIIVQLKKSKGLLLDAGSTINHSYILDELLHFKKIFITTLFPEKKNFPKKNVKYSYEDLEKIKFKKDYFDVITCVSTLEHIGFSNDHYNYDTKKDMTVKGYDHNKYLRVIKKLKYVLKKNGRLLLTIPYGKKEVFHNLQQFGKKDLKDVITVFHPKKFDIIYFVNKKNKWVQTNPAKIKNVQPKFKIHKNKKFVLSANSIALIEMTK